MVIWFGTLLTWLVLLIGGTCVGRFCWFDFGFLLGLIVVVSLDLVGFVRFHLVYFGLVLIVI